MFKVNDTLYAVSGEIINTIFVLEQPVTRVPMTKQHVHGIINVRGDVVPVVDLRVLFGLTTAKQNAEEFSQMLDHRKQDHIDWVNALKESAENKTEITLETDPHKCAFGKWYDSFKTDKIEIEHILRKIEEPHRKLHASAIDASHCSRKHDQCERDECLMVVVERAVGDYVEEILRLIDELKDAYVASTRQMVIVLQHENIQIGILVDEVVEVVDIESVFSLRNDTSHQSRFVYGIGSIEEYKKDILMLDVNAIVSDN